MPRLPCMKRNMISLGAGNRACVIGQTIVLYNLGIFIEGNKIALCLRTEHASGDNS